MAEHKLVDVELMVPREPQTAGRIAGFFEAIGWEVSAADEAYMSYVRLPANDGDKEAPTVGYWQTENLRGSGRFVDNPQAGPTDYARGLQLSYTHDLGECLLKLHTDQRVHDVFEAGGKVLQAHSYVPPREYDGHQEFRFADPFNYAFRVTALETASDLGTVSVGQDDFRASKHYGAQLTRAWNDLKKLTVSQPDFPLRFDNADDPEQARFVGDLEVAVAWLEAHKPYNKRTYTDILRTTLASHQQLAELRRTQPEPYAMREADLTEAVWRDIVAIYHKVALDHHTFSERDIAGLAYGLRYADGFIRNDEFRYGSRLSMHSKLHLTTPARGMVAFEFFDNLSSAEMYNREPTKRGVEIIELKLKKRVADYLRLNGLLQVLDDSSKP